MGHLRHTESASPTTRWHAALGKSSPEVAKNTKTSRSCKTQQIKDLPKIDMTSGTGDSPTVHRQRLSQPLAPNTELGRSPRLLCNTKDPHSVDGTRRSAAQERLCRRNQRRSGARRLHTTATGHVRPSAG